MEDSKFESLIIIIILRIKCTLCLVLDSSHFVYSPSYERIPSISRVCDASFSGIVCGTSVVCQ